MNNSSVNGDSSHSRVNESGKRAHLLRRSSDLRTRAKDLMELYGTTQSCLAQAMDIDRRTLSAFLRGKNATMRARTLDTLERVIKEREKILSFPRSSGRNTESEQPVDSGSGAALQSSPDEEAEHLSIIRSEIRRRLGDEAWFTKSIDSLSEDDLLRYFALCIVLKRKNNETEGRE